MVSDSTLPEEGKVHPIIPTIHKPHAVVVHLNSLVGRWVQMGRGTVPMQVCCKG